LVRFVIGYRESVRSIRVWHGERSPVGDECARERDETARANRDGDKEPERERENGSWIERVHQSTAREETERHTQRERERERETERERERERERG